MDTPQYVEIGQVVGVFGIKGEVKVKAYADFPERYKALKSCTARWPDGRSRELEVRGAKQHKTHILLMFGGVSNPNNAEELRGATLTVPFDERADLPPDTYYIADLVGLTVVTTDGDTIGPITEVFETPANDVYVTARGMIPAVKEFIKDVDFEMRRVVVQAVPGLFEPVDEE